MKRKSVHRDARTCNRLPSFGPVPDALMAQAFSENRSNLVVFSVSLPCAPLWHLPCRRARELVFKSRVCYVELDSLLRDRP